MQNVAVPVDLNALGRVEVVEDGGQARGREHLALLVDPLAKLIRGARPGTQEAEHDGLERIKSGSGHSPSSRIRST